MALQTVLIIVALVLLWGRALMSPPLMECGESPAILYGLLHSWLSPLPRLAVILAMILILIEAFGLNLLLSDAGLVSQNSLLPTLLYIIAMRAGCATLTPIVLVCGVAILCLRQLMLHGTLLTIPSGKVCAATGLIGIATLFYTPAAALMLTYLLVAANYRLYGWKDWALMILGFMAPLLALLCILYMTDGIAAWWSTTLAALSAIGLHSDTTPLLPLLGSVILAATLLWGLLTVNLRLTEHPVMWQKNASSVMLFTVGALGIMPYAPLLPVNMPLFALPFTFCTTRLFLDATAKTAFRKKKHLWLYDILLILLLAAALTC